MSRGRTETEMKQQKGPLGNQYGGKAPSIHSSQNKIHFSKECMISSIIAVSHKSIKITISI